MKNIHGVVRYTIIEKKVSVEYLKVVSEKTINKNPNKNVNLVCNLYLVLFFGKIIKKQQIIAMIGIYIGL